MARNICPLLRGLIAWLMLMPLTAFAAPVFDAVEWDQSSGFGGFSGLHVFANGRDFIALSDRGFTVTGHLLRSPDSRLTGLRTLTRTNLIEIEGAPLIGLRRDSEGLAIAPDGRVWISFETRPRIRLEGIDGQPPRELPRPPRQAGLHPNATYEALAFAPDGTLYTLPEGSPSYMTGFPVFQYTGGVWIQAFTLPPIDGFKPTGADFGPDGRLYILERAFSGLGFRTQVRRMLPNGTEQEVLIETPVGLHGNLEGISVWRSSDGTLRITMIADDNFNFFQRSEIVEYIISE